MCNGSGCEAERVGGEDALLPLSSQPPVSDPRSITNWRMMGHPRQEDRPEKDTEDTEEEAREAKQQIENDVLPGNR